MSCTNWYRLAQTSTEFVTEKFTLREQNEEEHKGKGGDWGGSSREYVGESDLLREFKGVRRGEESGEGVQSCR